MKQRKQLQLSKQSGHDGSALSRRLAYMLLLLVTFFAGGSSAWADEVTFTANNNTKSFTASSENTGITVTPNTQNYSSGYWAFGDGSTTTLTISSTSANISSITLNLSRSNNDADAIEANIGSYSYTKDALTASWSNSTPVNTVVFSGSKKQRIASLIITYESTLPTTHTVTYDLNGGTGTLPTQANVAEGATFTVADGTGFSKTGFDFAGWNDGSNDYAAGDTYTMGTSNVTLTAKWTAVKSSLKEISDIYYQLEGGEKINAVLNNGTYEITVPYADNAEHYPVYFTISEKATSNPTSPAQKTLNAAAGSTNPFTVTVTAEDGSTQDYHIKLIRAENPNPDPEPIGDAEVWFVYLKDKDNAGTTQSTIFKDANGATMEGLAKASSTDISGSITIGGKTFSITGRGSAGNKADISFTVPNGKTATFYGLASSAGTTARPLTLSCTDPAYSDVQYTSASKTIAADFKFENLVPGEYKLTSDANVAVEFLYLDLQGASNPVISTQPVGATYEYGATATALTVAAAPANGGVLSYQWYKSANADGSNPESFGTESTCTPSTDAVGTSYYYCVVTEANGGNVKSGIATVVVNKAKNTLAVSSNNVSIVVGENVIISYTTNSNAAVIYGSNGSSIASVESNSLANTFKINGTTVGTTTVTVSQNANDNYEASTQTINVTVVSSPVETLFYRDFTDSHWADATFTQTSKTGADVNFDVITNAKNDNKHFSWSEAGLNCPDNNMNNSYFIAIPVKNVNGPIIIDGEGSLNQIQYVIKQEDEISSTPGTYSTQGNNKVYHIQSETLNGNYVVYLMLKNGTLKNIKITTPTPEALSAPSSVSVSPATSTVGTGETVTLTATATDAYSYKWYKNTTNSTTGGTEIYGETIHELKVTPTEVGTYYYYCVGVNSKGESVSTNVATVNVVAIPVLNFVEAQKVYDKNTNSWNEGASPVLTITPDAIPAATLSTLFSKVQYTASESGFTYSAPNGIGQLSDITTQGTGFTITATLTVNNDVPGIKNGTYTASFNLDIIDGYADKLGANFTPEVGKTREVKDDDDNVILTLGFGGWTHGSNSDNHTWTNDKGSMADEWPKTNIYTKGTVIDGYSQQSQAKTDARSETKGNIVWEKEYEKVYPYTLPCRGAYITVTPEKNGKLTIYLVQNGCVDEDVKDEPLCGSPRVYYWFDSEGNCIPAETHLEQKLGFTYDENYSAQAASNWKLSENPELQSVVNTYWAGKGENDLESAIPYQGGFFLIKKAYIKYNVNLLAGKTYYFFSNGSKMGYAGLNFAPSHDGTVEIGLPQGGTETVNTVEALALKDDVAFEKPSTTTAYNEVTLNRTFKAGVWNTICLPFSVSKEQVERVFGKGTVFVGYNGFSDNTLHLIYHAYDYLLPGQPYFIKPTGTNADLNNIVFENVTITSNAEPKDYDAANVTDGTFDFVGLFNGTQLNTYDHYMNGSGNIAFSSTKKVDLKGYRAYLKNNTNGAAQVKAIAYANFDDDMDEPTSIEGLIEYLESEGVKVVPTGGVYNLSGQKVADDATNLPAGIYIIKGKKVVIK